MKDIFKVVLAIVLAIVFIVGMAFGGLALYRYFAPKYEGARREVFENTRSYNQAKVQELGKYRLEYLQAEEDDKLAVASTIRHRFADFDSKGLPYELAQFLREIRGY